jgi:hypothetical protein
MALSKKQIFAHRGMWLESGLEKNSMGAFQLAFEEGFGIEVDIRDHVGKIVISHDPPTEAIVEFEALIDLASRFPELPVAINVKSDGLSMELARYQIANPHFYFDMSVPQERDFLKRGLVVASRISEYEPVERGLHQILWVDAFEDDWYFSDNKSMTVIKNSSSAVFVSPELHGRDRSKAWEVLGPLIKEVSHLGVCTDYPSEFSAKWFLS